ncbi:MAG: hypothetical protein OXQ31_10885 [Spirochaetaceae bacterium]|nr:hypothetical protein [Spirochaetaceae bacterium]
MDVPSDIVGRFTFDDGRYVFHQRGGDRPYRGVGIYISDDETE